MINKISIDSITQIKNFDKYTSAILRYNNIDENNLAFAIPDSKFHYTFQEYFDFAEVIDGTSEYISAVQAHKNEKWGCISDHDCDGIMACIIMSASLAKYGIDITYLPTCRFSNNSEVKTGYGMGHYQIDKMISLGVKVIVTVDQGITTLDAIEYAKSKGLFVIVTDHHNGLIDNLADVVIDPCYFKNHTKFKQISGATVALKLNYALYKSENLDTSIFNELGVLAGITVLSDVMQMQNENRILYKAAADYCNSHLDANNFITRLFNLLGFVYTEYKDGEESYPEFRDFNVTNVNFYLVPVVNAVNRVNGEVDEIITNILELFFQESNCSPTYYTDINKARKQMKKDLQNTYVPKYDYSVVVEALKIDSIENYSGIAGLFAADIADDEKKPTLIGIDQGQEVINMSGRSVPGYDLYKLLTRIQSKYPDLGLTFGGHAEALGAAIHRDKLNEFRKILNEEFLADNYEVKNDYFILDNTNAWLNVYRRLSPFSNGFEMPRFYSRTTIRYYDGKSKTFSLVGCGTCNIACFSNSDLEYIGYLKFHAPNTNIEVLLELCYDAKGTAMFKLIKILNKDVNVLREIRRLKTESNYF